MYLTEANVADITKKQYKYKMNAYLNAFTAMIAVQIAALSLSLLGVGSMGSHSENISLSAKLFSSNLVIGFTMIWGLYIGVTMTTRVYRNCDFTFVTNRLTSNVSNILFLITASVIGGVTSMLSGMLLRVGMFFYYDQQFIINEVITLGQLFVGTIVAILYIVLLASVGYFVGTLSQLHSMIKIVLPILIFGALFFGAGNDGIATATIQFFIGETTLYLFIVKVILTSIALFIASLFVSNRLEVR
ncbi:hypothetical protein BKP37_02440 [Anaerobacillus alkalilacustris]|uniref:Uncharacterized protein n=1 Tax=Anaerobacillus alkalilacustris TaxID=393763 RepID=A0A1S2LY02_9BACI|nr:hypothetical protein [Anaerobacillus alkalilacustris]OIJ17382.1 hypothetical protein BKP37_02440 [Anaerobacillus alkalilacustris]